MTHDVNIDAQIDYLNISYAMHRARDIDTVYVIS